LNRVALVLLGGATAAVISTSAALSRGLAGAPAPLDKGGAPSVLVIPSLCTCAELVVNRIGTIEDLASKIPAFRASDAATAPWIPATK
jgi:simple sugar transport system substrate-binding protein